MRILVTGAAGFIGRYVVKTARADGYDVVALDCVQAPGLDVMADIAQPLPEMGHLDAVIHLAAVAHPRDCDNDPGKAFSINVNGTHQVLKLALSSGAKKVVFASTAHVYGISPRYMPTDENHPLWLQNNYTITKILGEELCELYHTNHGLSYTILRLFNAYGPGQQLGYFIPDMIAKAQQGDINLPGGNTTKDWVYVEDVARAFVIALSTPFVGAINIGTGKETELSDIAGVIADAAGVVRTSTPSPTATRMCADISRAQRVLGWSPSKSITEGLHAIISDAVLAEP